MSDVFLEITDEDGKRTAIRRDLIMYICETDDRTIQVGVSWPGHGMEYHRFEGVTYGDFVNKLTSLKEEK